MKEMIQTRCGKVQKGVGQLSQNVRVIRALIVISMYWKCCFASILYNGDGKIKDRKRRGREHQTTHVALNLDGVLGCAEVGHLEGLHVEDLLVVEAAEELVSLETGSLLLVGSNVTSLGTVALDDGGTSSESERRGGEQAGGGAGSSSSAESAVRACDKTTGSEGHVGIRRG